MRSENEMETECLKGVMVSFSIITINFFWYNEGER